MSSAEFIMEDLTLHVKVKQITWDKKEGFYRI